jgi:hypothetical protein
MARRDHDLSPEDVIERARTRLNDAHHELSNYRAHTRPEDKLRSFRQLVIATREVTFALQRMAGVADLGEKWPDWYATYQDEMRGDPLLRAFHQLRDYFAKQGGMSPGGISVHIGHLNTQEIRYYFLEPRWAKGFFIGDRMGRSGWEIQRPGEKTEYRYVDLPARWGIEVSFLLDDPPERHLGQDIRDKPIDELAELVITYFEQLVDAAEAEFTDT